MNKAYFEFKEGIICSWDRDTHIGTLHLAEINEHIYFRDSNLSILTSGIKIHGLKVDVSEINKSKDNKLWAHVIVEKAK